MSLYPPLTQVQLTELQETVVKLYELRRKVADTGLTLILKPGDEDDLVRAITEARVVCNAYNDALFRVFNQVHRLKESNVPTTLPPPRPKHVEPLTTDTLEDLLR